jgi:hypothetical protein
MASKAPKVRPSDLPTKVVHGPNGQSVRVKVIQSESPTLADDLLAAFRSNVRRITEVRRKHTHVGKNASET